MIEGSAARTAALASGGGAAICIADVARCGAESGPDRSANLQRL